MIAYARVNGVTAFWGANPNTDAGDVRMVWLRNPTHKDTHTHSFANVCAQHWPTEGGDLLLVKQGESRCILVSSGVSPSEKMYARFRPCDAKLGSGILTVAAAAVGRLHFEPPFWGFQMADKRHTQTFYRHRRRRPGRQSSTGTTPNRCECAF